MRPMMTGMKLFDGKVVSADELYAAQPIAQRLQAEDEYSLCEILHRSRT